MGKKNQLWPVRLGKADLRKAFPKATDAAIDSVKAVVSVGKKGYSAVEQALPIEKITKVPQKTAKKLGF